MSDMALIYYVCFFFFNDTATTEIYTLSLHDALPISCVASRAGRPSIEWSRSTANSSPVMNVVKSTMRPSTMRAHFACVPGRSEEHTSELQSQSNLVCRLLLEKKKRNTLRIAAECRLQ